ncbi:hypothetical protein AAFF_G00129130 [Aldrovandia affinis]|uniref:Uncharacterized protein n=1 Tax=Aldrovandia affinis TaxID=143900 RepID=A0AAD7T1A1_9TELE|nr:hypothetical protein AAFF_G00129130 [Aldrovandia affinis]
MSPLSPRADKGLPVVLLQPVAPHRPPASSSHPASALLRHGCLKRLGADSSASSQQRGLSSVASVTAPPLSGRCTLIYCARLLSEGHTGAAVWSQASHIPL